tara:strand:+ start:13242 stop:14210 length:969 start_codon:yes stop_codon:yes gene_type:complete
MADRKVLITGITGQDGIFLTSELLKNDKNIKIFGISRNANKKFYENLTAVGVKNFSNVNIHNLDLTDLNSVKKYISDLQPTEIYNLSGPSSVYESILNSDYYKTTINTIFDNLTDACISAGMTPRFFQACSSEMFSSENILPLNEGSVFNPRSPYSEAKYTVYKKTNDLRKNGDWNIKSGIMFNHESEFRNDDYLFIKIINSAKSIKDNKADTLELGSLEMVRDWSFAGDVASAIYLINNSDYLENFVIGSGRGVTIEYVVETIFDYYDLEYNSFVKVNNSLLREGDPLRIISDPKSLINKLGWNPQYNIDNLIERLIKYIG